MTKADDAITTWLDADADTPLPSGVSAEMLYQHWNAIERDLSKIDRCVDDAHYRRGQRQLIRIHDALNAIEARTDVAPARGRSRG
jgi:hypothetical protein